jgi:1,4-dihydroxy-2-naphthoyl-CoA hydrolase
MTEIEQDPATVWASIPFTATLGAELLDATPEAVRARVGWDESRCTVGGVLHGGVLMALADSAGALCAFLNLPPEAAGTTTIESKTNFLRAVRRGAITATARPLHAGSRFVVVETDVLDDGDRRVARTTQTQAVLMP